MSVSEVSPPADTRTITQFIHAAKILLSTPTVALAGGVEVWPVTDATAALVALSAATAVPVWTLARSDPDGWAVLATTDTHPGAPPGRPARITASIQVEGEAVGALWGYPTDATAELAIESAQRLAAAVATLIGRVLSSERAALEVAEALSIARRDAVTDALVGLFNRRGWDEALTREEARCRRYGHGAAILVIDLDGLKALNDAHGHAAGDDLLRRSATLLSRASRAGDTVARLGGDEFGILAVECWPAEAIGLADRLHRNLRTAGVPAAIGVASRDETTGLHGAWQLADVAMYRSKADPERKPVYG